MTALQFTPAAERDAEALADLRVAAMRESLVRIGRFDPERARARLLDAFDPSVTTIVSDGRSRVGFYVVRSVEGELLLDHLYVAPEHQGRGIGAAVLRRVFDEADRLGANVRVGALRGSGSNRFYQRHGFESTGESEFDIYYVRPPAAAAGSRDRSA